MNSAAKTAAPATVGAAVLRSMKGAPEVSNNMILKRVAIDLDKPRKLAFDLNAFAAMEDYYPTAEDAFTAVEQGSFKGVRTVLWAGLQREATDAGEVLTLEAVGRMVTMDQMPALSKALLEALSASVPDAAKAKAADAQGEAKPAKKPAATA